jgi:hypothetical protein
MRRTTETPLSSKFAHIAVIHFFRYPFVAADVLSTNHQIMQAILEGGWLQKGPEPDENEKKGDESAGDEEFDEEKAENKMVQSILNKDNVSIDTLFKIL